jgi:hypothetical protein
MKISQFTTFPRDSSGPQINRALTDPHQAANQCTVAEVHLCTSAQVQLRTGEIT